MTLTLWPILFAPNCPTVCLHKNQGGVATVHVKGQVSDLTQGYAVVEIDHVLFITGGLK